MGKEEEQPPLPCGCVADDEQTSRAADTKVKWNPYNKVVQCHGCGTVYKPTEVLPRQGLIYE